MSEEKNMKYKSDSKRIAKNTLMLYIRQILILFVSLYTSRVVLNALGASDYGVYNVVGGFVSMFSIISGAFSVAIARFMSYILESEEKQKLSDLFSTSIIIQVISGVVVCSLIAIFGVWYVTNKMVIPEDRVSAALWVLLFSAISFFFSLISVPYNALLIANEHMKAYAYISIAEAVLKLLVAVTLNIAPFDKLIVYGALTCIAAVTVRMLYAGYCRKHFPECKFRWKLDKEIFKKMLSFVGWTFLGNGAVVLKDQGINMILNLFGGPVVNAARAIAISVNNAISGFVNNFIQATQPQITKLCSTRQYNEMHDLIYRSCKISFFLTLVMTTPVIKNIDYILSIWLGEVPQYTSFFVIFTLVDLLVYSLMNPLLYGVLAEGNIKKYEITLTLTYVLGVIIVYFWLANGGIIEFVYIFTVILRLCILIALIWQSAETYKLSVLEFLNKVILRISIVVIITVFLVAIFEVNVGVKIVDFILESMWSVACVVSLVTFIGLNSSERNAIINIVKRKLLKI